MNIRCPLPIKGINYVKFTIDVSLYQYASNTKFSYLYIDILQTKAKTPINLSIWLFIHHNMFTSVFFCSFIVEYRCSFLCLL